MGKLKTKTTLWRETPSGPVLIKTLAGFPFGIPALGGLVNVPNLGAMRCAGVVKSGAASNEHTVEIKLVLK